MADIAVGLPITYKSQPAFTRRAADFDNDDLFVTYYGHSVLYHNERNSTFKDVTEAAGLKSDTVRWDTGCSFVDYDLDGNLDLVITSYLEFDRDKIPELRFGWILSIERHARHVWPRPSFRTNLSLS